MNHQKHLFNLDEGKHYFNNAYKAPLLKSAEAACLQALERERNPYLIKPSDFFEDAVHIRELFANLIHADRKNVAIGPATSFFFATALSNIKSKTNGNAITVDDEFPSGYFALKRWCADHQNQLVTVGPEESPGPLGQEWNDVLTDSINDDTSVVLISSVHWQTGMKFDLERIGNKCKEVGAILIVDGTQSVGALPLDIQKLNIDVLVCATYKWLFGPYSLALAYFDESFFSGRPLTESWMNRVHAQDFANLTEYQDAYSEGASRFNIGETSNFILLPILKAGLTQVNVWTPEAIQGYCHTLVRPVIDYLASIGAQVEDDAYFSPHLFSFSLGKEVNVDLIIQILTKHGIIVSVRGPHIRIATHLYNDENDIQALLGALRDIHSFSQRDKS